MFIELNGAMHHYVSEGEGPPVVLIHGLGGSAGCWSGVAQTLALHHHVITVDLRGFGQSSKLTSRISIKEYAEDVLALIDALELPPVTLVGHSMGSLVAQMAAAWRPSSINSLILAGPISWFAPEHRKAYLEQAKHVEHHGLSELGETWIKGALCPRTRAILPQWAGMLQEFYVANDVASMAHAFRAMAEYVPIDHSNIGKPTLLLVGDHDQSTPVAMAEELDAVIPVSRLRIIPSAAHWLMLEQPDVVASEIMNWLSFR